MTQQQTMRTKGVALSPRLYIMDAQLSAENSRHLGHKGERGPAHSVCEEYGKALQCEHKRQTAARAVRRIVGLIEQWYGPVIMELVSAWAHGQGFAEQVRRIYSEPGMEAEQHLLYSYRPKLYEADRAPASQMAATRNAVLRFLRSLRDRLTDDPQVFELLTQAGWRI